MHELVGLLTAEHDFVLAADEGDRVDQQGDPEVLGRQPRPHQRMQQVGRGPEIPLGAQLMELPVLCQERESVREDHGRSQMIEEIRGRECAGGAVVGQEAVREERGEVDVLGTERPRHGRADSVVLAQGLHAHDFAGGEDEVGHAALGRDLQDGVGLALALQGDAFQEKFQAVTA